MKHDIKTQFFSKNTHRQSKVKIDFSRPVLINEHNFKQVMIFFWFY